MQRASCNKVQLFDNFSPYLYIDTGLRLTAGDNAQHYLHFSPQFQLLRISEQLCQIFEQIQSHMEITRGQLAERYIRRYFFVFDKNVALEITPSGKIVATHEDFDLSRLNSTDDSREQANSYV